MSWCANPVPLQVSGKEWLGNCGKCLRCRIAKRSIWTMRMLHETDSKGDAGFVTLTYDNDNLPASPNRPLGLLLKSDLQKFFKRLRAFYSGRVEGVPRRTLRYYGNGEYGDLHHRPHYHAIVWGLTPVDYRQCKHLWDLGRWQIDTCSGHSIQYVAGYVTKKLGGEGRKDYPAEFQIFSNGIGVDWLKENYVQVLYDAALAFRGRKVPIPVAYKKALLDIWPEAAEGTLERLISEKIVAEADASLALVEEFGGRTWSQLNDEERVVMMTAYTSAGQQYNNDLKQRLDIKLKGSSVRQNIRKERL